MKSMSDVEARAFLLAGTKTGKLATVRADGEPEAASGRPHVVPIWFLLDGDDLVFTTWHKSVKGLNLQRDGRLALCVDNENPPYDFVMLEGTATLHEDPEQSLYWATRIAARYMGEELAELYGRRNGVPGEWLVRVHITKIVARKDVAGF